MEMPKVTNKAETYRSPLLWRIAPSSAEVSVMGMERRGRRTQATGIIQLLNKEEDMMKEAKPFVIDYVYAQRVECEEPCEGRLSRTVL